MKIIKNFRDIATHLTLIKPNQIFRGAEPTAISDIAFPIQTIIDLRAKREIAENPYAVTNNINYKSCPFDPWNQSKSFKSLNIKGSNVEIACNFFIIDCKPFIKEAIEAIIESKGAIFIHCVHGKDRTGILIVLIAMLAGESKEAIEADFMASKADTNTKNLSIIYKVIQQHGSIELYLHSCGLAAKQLEILKQKLL